MPVDAGNATRPESGAEHTFTGAHRPGEPPSAYLYFMKTKTKMITYFRSKKTLQAQIVELTRKLQNLDNEITQRERNKYFQEKMEMMSENEKAIMELIRKHEARVISESARAADEMELSMMETIEKKETRIKELELENIELRTSYRNFKNDVQEYEVLTQTVDADLQAAQTMTAQLAAKFSGIKYRMQRIGERVDKKSTQLITEGKG